jgi:hypothetical protein
MDIVEALVFQSKRKNLGKGFSKYIRVHAYNYSDFCWDECLKVTLTW